MGVEVLASNLSGSCVISPIYIYIYIYIYIRTYIWCTLVLANVLGGCVTLTSLYKTLTPVQTRNTPLKDKLVSPQSILRENHTFFRLIIYI